MIIEIAKVSSDGSLYEGEELPEVLELEKDKLVRIAGPVRYSLFAEVVGRELIVKGTVEVPVSLECSRCTDFFSTSVRVSSFLRAYEISEGTEAVDLTPDLREDILLEMPPYPVCSPECRGLCPQCGKNRNSDPCSCRPPSGEGRWGGLDGVKLP